MIFACIDKLPDSDSLGPHEGIENSHPKRLISFFRVFPTQTQPSFAAIDSIETAWLPIRMLIIKDLERFPDPAEDLDPLRATAASGYIDADVSVPTRPSLQELSS